MITSVLDDEIYEAADREARTVKKAIRKAKDENRQVFDWTGRYTPEVLQDMGIRPDPWWFVIIKWIVLGVIIFLGSKELLK